MTRHGTFAAYNHHRCRCEVCTEFDAEMANAHADTGFVIAKPPGKTDPADWYCILRPAVLLDLMRAAGWMPLDTPRLASVADVVELHPNPGDGAA